jgi:hypothetical protein
MGAGPSKPTALSAVPKKHWSRSWSGSWLTLDMSDKDYQLIIIQFGSWTYYSQFTDDNQ